MIDRYLLFADLLFFILFFLIFEIYHAIPVWDSPALIFCPLIDFSRNATLFTRSYNSISVLFKCVLTILVQTMSDSPSSHYLELIHS